MLAVSISPRFLLKFGHCKREEGLDWNVQCVRSEIEAAKRYGEGEVSAVVAVDEEEGRIAGMLFGDGVGR
jgi:hypothetical protein